MVSQRTIAAVTGLKLMLLSNGPSVQDQLGLPVGPACGRERGRRAEEAATAVEARRLAALAAAEAERQAAWHAAARRAGRLHDAASAALGPDAATWLDTVHAAASPTHDRLARRAEALDALRGISAERERLAAVEALRELLRAQARTGPNPDRGHLFLTSGNPRFRNLRPIDFCSDERSFGLVSVALAAAMTNSRGLVPGGGRRWDDVTDLVPTLEPRLGGAGHGCRRVGPAVHRSSTAGSCGAAPVVLQRSQTG